jgi:hypothetical protein
MKHDVMRSIVQNGTGRTFLEPQLFKQLVREVKETVATDVDCPKEPKASFGIVDLWNIRRNRRYAGKTRKKTTVTPGFKY